MERLTKAAAGGGYVVDGSLIKKCAESYTGEAIARLAKFENILEQLLIERDDTTARLEKLRKEGREKSVTFKQLLARKLMNSNMLSLLESDGISDNK